MNNDKDNATLYAELKAERFMTDQISLLHEAEDLADGINFMLKSIGEFTDADRAYVFETSENHTSTNTYEWCAAGVTPQIRNLHDIPFESMPKWIEVFLHGENILIEDLEAYRESMPLEYELLKVQNVSTLIAFPIAVHEKLYCMLTESSNIILLQAKSPIAAYELAVGESMIIDNRKLAAASSSLICEGKFLQTLYQMLGIRKRYEEKIIGPGRLWLTDTPIKEEES